MAWHDERVARLFQDWPWRRSIIPIKEALPSCPRASIASDTRAGSPCHRVRSASRSHACCSMVRRRQTMPNQPSRPITRPSIPASGGHTACCMPQQSRRCNAPTTTPELLRNCSSDGRMRSALKRNSRKSGSCQFQRMIDRMPFYQSRHAMIMIDKSIANQPSGGRRCAILFAAMAETRAGFRRPA